MTSTVSQSPVHSHPSPLTVEHRLRLVLRANAASSAVSGLVMALAPETINDLLGTSAPGWIRLVGLALLPFAVFVGWLSSAEVHHLRQHTLGIVAGDVVWVGASVVTVLLSWYSASGVVAVLAMAAVVDVFAVLQFMSWRRLR